jgi:hypothetical protein
MESHTRRAIAYIAGRLINGGSGSSIYDYSESRYDTFGGNVSEASVSVFDYEQSCYVSGSSTNLFHYGDGHYVTLRVAGTKFSGFDYGSSNHFSGTVNGRSLSVYDYGTSSYYQYSI